VMLADFGRGHKPERADGAAPAGARLRGW
jgi:hypothetical protein